MTTPPTAPSPPAPPAPVGASARRIAGNALALATSTILARLAMFVLGVALANQLGPDDYGRYGIGISLAVVLVPLADLGFTPYVTREVARSRANTDAALRALTLGRAFLAVVASVVAAGAIVLLVDDPRTEWALLLAVAAAAFDGLAQYGFAYFQGIERMGPQARITAVAAVIRAAGGVVLALATGSLALVLVWLLVGSVAQAAWTLVRVRREAAPTPKAERRAVPWRAVLAMGGVAILVAIIVRVDSVLVGALRGEADAGQYTAAWTLMGGLQVVPWMVSVALLPVFSRTFVSDRETYVRALSQGTRSVILVSAPIALLLSVLADPIIDRFFGSAYEPAATALAILIWSVPLAAVNSIAAMALRGASRERPLTVALGAAAAGNIGVNLWAIETYGINGAAATNVGTEAFLIVVLYAALARGRALRRLELGLVRLALALGGLTLAALLLRDRVPVEVALLAGVAAYVAIAWGTRLVTAADLRTLRRP